MKRLGYLVIAWLAVGTVSAFVCAVISPPEKIYQAIAYGYLAPLILGGAIVTSGWAIWQFTHDKETP